MSRESTTAAHPQFSEPQRSARPAWRQSLVLAERGFVRSARGDSAFSVYFFGGSVVLAMAVVLGIGWMEWIAVVICLTLVFSAELFNQALKAIASGTEPAPAAVTSAANPQPVTIAQRVASMGTAAVLVTMTGSLVVIVMIFWQRLHQMLPSR